MPDVNDKDFMLLIVDLVQHAPISHEACAPDAIQRRARGFPSRFGLSISGPVMKSTAAAATSGGSFS